MLSVEDGLQLKALADGKGLRVGSRARTPSSAARTSCARKLIDEGASAPSPPAPPT